MKEGAFALIDCLGFKGIWKRMEDENPEPLIRKLKLIEETVQKQIEKREGLASFSEYFPIKAKVRLLSDTVAISLQVEDDYEEKVERWQEGQLVFLISQTVIEILALFIKGKPHLVMRGCITYGKHISEGNFIAGFAVDEAAEYMNIADGAFVWLHPSAAEKFDHYLLKMEQENHLGIGNQAANLRKKILDYYSYIIVSKEYEMPIKGGGFLECPVLNPLFYKVTRKDREEVIKAYSKAMTGNKLDIWLKKQNTMKMLKAASESVKRFEEEIFPLIANSEQ